VFTGLVEGRGRLVARRPAGGGAVLEVSPPFPAAELALGDSVAVAGVCLTVTGLRDTIFQSDVSAESLSRTTLGRLNLQAPLNIERAVRLGDRLGGHLSAATWTASAG
jgi:riboflavin synthase